MTGPFRICLQIEEDMGCNCDLVPGMPLLSLDLYEGTGENNENLTHVTYSACQDVEIMYICYQLNTDLAMKSLSFICV
jgi:hypothetical protein